MVPASAWAAVDPAAAVVINEVYGGGGNNGASYTHDFIELRNTSDDVVSVDGWSVQYASSAGTNWSGVAALSGEIAAGELYLVRLATGGANGAPLPTPDATGGFNMSGSNGNVALASQAGALSCTTTGCASDAAVVDLVGFGSGAAFAGSQAPSGSNSTSISRDADGTNTADNGDDFTAGAPTPGALADDVEAHRAHRTLHRRDPGHGRDDPVRR